MRLQLDLRTHRTSLSPLAMSQDDSDKIFSITGSGVAVAFVGQR